MPRVQVQEKVVEITGDCYKPWLRSWVRRNKVRKIGEGAFANVYSSKSAKHVYKVCGVNPDPDYEEGDGYWAYLTEVVLPHQGNPIVPRIQSVELITLTLSNPQKPVHDGLYAGLPARAISWWHTCGMHCAMPELQLYIVKMEKLHGFKKPGGLRKAIALLQKWGAEPWPKSDPADDYYFEDFEDECLKKTAKRDKTGQLQPIAKTLMKLQTKYALDLHNENVMWRRGPGRNNWQLVITDPVA